MFIILPLKALTFIPSCDPFYLSFILIWSLAIYLVPDRVPFSRAFFRVESRSGVLDRWLGRLVMVIAIVAAAANALVIAAVSIAI